MPKEYMTGEGADFVESSVLSMSFGPRVKNRDLSSPKREKIESWKIKSEKNIFFIIDALGIVGAR